MITKYSNNSFIIVAPYTCFVVNTQANQYLFLKPNRIPDSMESCSTYSK